MFTTSETRSHPSVLIHGVSTRIIIGILLAGLSGLMFLLAFPPQGLWFLAWFGFVPALLAHPGQYPW